MERWVWATPFLWRRGHTIFISYGNVSVGFFILFFSLMDRWGRDFKLLQKGGYRIFLKLLWKDFVEKGEHVMLLGKI